MINLLMGPPGAGKSYEAVVFHILPALLEGRKVITNLPLQVDAFREYGVSSSLIELKNPTLENPKPFSTIEDYGSDWRGENGIGPLYVIDEGHKVKNEMTNISNQMLRVNSEGRILLTGMC